MFFANNEDLSNFTKSINSHTCLLTEILITTKTSPNIEKTTTITSSATPVAIFPNNLEYYLKLLNSKTNAYLD